MLVIWSAAVFGIAYGAQQNAPPPGPCDDLIAAVCLAPGPPVWTFYAVATVVWACGVAGVQLVRRFVRRA